MRLVGDAALPEKPYFLKVTFLPEDGSTSGIDWGGECFDERREIVVRATSPGRMRVAWVVERRSSGGGMATMIPSDPEVFVEVLDTDAEQVFDVELDAAGMERLVGHLE